MHRCVFVRSSSPNQPLQDSFPLREIKLSPSRFVRRVHRCADFFWLPFHGLAKLAHPLNPESLMEARVVVRKLACGPG